MEQTFEVLTDKFRNTVLSPLIEELVDKKEIIELLAVTAVAGENLLMLGPPGTAKSQIVQNFATRLEGRYFECLLTRFSEPNELFGPVDLLKLKEGVVETNTQGMLPDAEFAFLDEVFNGNSAILNSLLNVLNERTFRRGRERKKLDLFCVVGASNNLPEDTALRALYDRFLMRVKCDHVADSSLPLLFEKGWKIEVEKIHKLQQQVKSEFTVKDLQAICSFLPKVELKKIRDPYLEMVRKIRKAGIALSDRRIVRCLRMVAASSLFCGRLEATPTDFWVLRYIWDSEAQIGILDELVTQTIRNYIGDLELRGEEVSQVHEMAANRSGMELEEIANRFDAVQKFLHQEELSDLERMQKKEILVELLRLCSWFIPKNQEQRKALDALVENIEVFLNQFGPMR